MVEALFSFGGRMGRLAYLGWTFAVVGASFVFVFAALLGGAASIPSVGRANAPFLVLILFGILAIVGVWSTLALSVKRIRDTGFSPLLVIGGTWLILIFDRFFLAVLLDTRFMWPFAHEMPIDGLVQLAYVLFLLLWPSDNGRGMTYEEPDAAPAPPARASASFGSSPPPARAPAAFGVTGPRREFGLRQR